MTTNQSIFHSTYKHSFCTPKHISYNIQTFILHTKVYHKWIFQFRVYNADLTAWNMATTRVYPRCEFLQSENEFIDEKVCKTHLLILCEKLMYSGCKIVPWSQVPVSFHNSWLVCIHVWADEWKIDESYLAYKSGIIQSMELCTLSCTWRYWGCNIPTTLYPSQSWAHS